MALVGKKFPDFDVDAMNEMGDTFKINVYDEAVKNGKKYSFFGILRTLLLFVQLRSEPFRMHWESLKREIQ